MKRLKQKITLYKESENKTIELINFKNYKAAKKYTKEVLLGNTNEEIEKVVYYNTFYWKIHFKNKNVLTIIFYKGEN